MNNDVAVRRFSKTIAATLVAMGFVALVFFVAAIRYIWQAVTSGLPILLVGSVVALIIGTGFVYVMLELHRRRNWARYLAASLWVMCFILSATRIVRHGFHPEAPSGPLQYTNEAQLAGARFVTLVEPYCMAVIELSAIFCLLKKNSLVNQFRRPIA